MSSDIQTYCESVFRSLSSPKISTIFRNKGYGRKHSSCFDCVAGGLLLIVLHIKDGCGVRLYILVSRGRERSAEYTKTAPHFLIVFQDREAA